MSSCATSKIQTDKANTFKKICVEGSGKGRIELMSTKHTFSYESQFDRTGNKFDLVLDFPVVGEKEIALSLDPETVNRSIKDSEITELLYQHLTHVPEKHKVAKAVTEFFVFASDFMRFKALNIYPKHFEALERDGHFIMERTTPSYRFVVDNFSPNQKFFERVVFRIFIKGFSSDPVLTLFLVPTECDF